MDRRNFLALSSLSILGVPSLSFGEEKKPIELFMGGTEKGWIKMHESMLYDVLKKNTSEKGMALTQLMNKYFREIEKHDKLVNYVYSSLKNRELIIEYAPSWLVYDIVGEDNDFQAWLAYDIVGEDNDFQESYQSMAAEGRETEIGLCFDNQRYYMWTAKLVANDNCEDMIIFSNKMLDIKSE